MNLVLECWKPNKSDRLIPVLSHENEERVRVVVTMRLEQMAVCRV